MRGATSHAATRRRSRGTAITPTASTTSLARSRRGRPMTRTRPRLPPPSTTCAPSTAWTTSALDRGGRYLPARDRTRGVGPRGRVHHRLPSPSPSLPRRARTPRGTVPPSGLERLHHGIGEGRRPHGAPGGGRCRVSGDRLRPESDREACVGMAAAPSLPSGAGVPGRRRPAAHGPRLMEPRRSLRSLMRCSFSVTRRRSSRAPGLQLPMLLSVRTDEADRPAQLLLP